MQSGPNKGLQRVKKHVNMEPGLTMIDLADLKLIVPELLLALALAQCPKRDSQHPEELDDGANPADGLLLALEAELLEAAETEHVVEGVIDAHTRCGAFNLHPEANVEKQDVVEGKYRDCD